MASWRRSSGERRQQLKWLATGIAALVVCAAISTVVGIGTASGTGPIVNACILVGLVAFSLCVAVAVLRYRLFDIDRVISRTLAYAIVTGLLVGVYAGIVLLATEVLGFHHSTVAVAAATLAAAALLTRCAAGCRRGWTGDSTGPAMTPTGSSPRSRPGCRTRSTWTPCGPI